MDERTIDDGAPVSAADALAIIEREQARTEPDIGPFFLLWGALWLVIGLGWFAAGQGVVDPRAAGIATLVAVVVGSVASTLLGRRIGRGVSGPSSRQGLMYGLCWLVALVATGAIVGGMARFGDPVSSTIAPALFVFVVGVMYTAGGVFWRSTLDFGLGVVVQVIAVLAVFVDAPWNSLLVGVLGGGALIVVGAYRSIRYRRANR
ncbi:hypothetical protein [Pseudonocardia endophytica]|uniref:Uncharacterized protein n=1 Tax=Pseudonocardia endophytica TaxID=401976 RepID=A0A4R1I477_PSEEN|nr:hypothetical protein [Pseudonocardia endophytica]TCK27349.1 hypothetical protein EV378_3220 [Pseudonocardia endophytica]